MAQNHDLVCSQDFWLGILDEVNLISCATFFIVSLGSLFAHAQVATAPLQPDQRLVNPAVLPGRVLRGYSLSFRREATIDKTPEESEATLNIGTTVDTVGFNAGWAPAPYYFELNLLPQFGSRKISSTFKEFNDGKGGTDTTDLITLVPLQGLFAIRLGNFGNIGIKALYTSASFSQNEEYAFGSNWGKVISNTKKSRSFELLSASAGGVLNIFGTGLYAGASTEYIQLKDDVTEISAFTLDPDASPWLNSSTDKRKSTSTLRKSVLGLGYLLKLSGGNVWRIDVSQETMPALDAKFPKDGKKIRVVTEATWSYFHLGVEATSTTGHYVDPYSLIPYFYGTQDLNAEAVIEYGFFGGLKSSKGHSFGVSYSQSSQPKTEKIANSEQTVSLDSKTVSYGLSYMYAF